MLTRVAQGRAYANVLGKLRKKTDSDASGIKLVETGPTKKEDILIMIGGPSNKDF